MIRNRRSTILKLWGQKWLQTRPWWRNLTEILKRTRKWEAQNSLNNGAYARTKRRSSWSKISYLTKFSSIAKSTSQKVPNRGTIHPSTSRYQPRLCHPTFTILQVVQGTTWPTANTTIQSTYTEGSPAQARCMMESSNTSISTLKENGAKSKQTQPIIQPLGTGIPLPLIRRKSSSSEEFLSTNKSLRIAAFTLTVLPIRPLRTAGE